MISKTDMRPGMDVSDRQSGVRELQCLRIEQRPCRISQYSGHFIEESILHHFFSFFPYHNQSWKGAYSPCNLEIH